MGNFLRGLVNKADDVIRGGGDIVAAKSVRKFGQQTLKGSIKSNMSALDETTLLGRAANSAKNSKFVNMMRPEKLTQTLDVSGETIAKLENEALLGTRNKINEINAALKNVVDDSVEIGGQKISVANANKNLAALREKETYINNIIRDKQVTTSAPLGDRIANYYRDEQYGRKRMGVTAGAIGIGMVGARVATGGNLTHNGDGRRDIIGIPFI